MTKKFVMKMREGYAYSSLHSLENAIVSQSDCDKATFMGFVVEPTADSKLFARFRVDGQNRYQLAQFCELTTVRAFTMADCESAKRASTTAKITKSAYAEMVAFMIANNCGMIVRIKGVEYAAYAKENQVWIEGESCDYPLRVVDAKQFTVRKYWNTESNIGTGLPQFDIESYRQWELAYAHELWRMDTDSMLAYA